MLYGAQQPHDEAQIRWQLHDLPIFPQPIKHE